MELKRFKRIKRLFLIILLLISLPLYIFFTNLHLSIQRGYQKRNMADMRAIGTAIEGYAVDHKTYPPGDSTVSVIREYLEPTYIKKVPEKDKWGNYFLYQSSSDLQSYTITSYGKDHKQDLPGHYKGVIARFTNDITFSQGSFTAFPIGI
ncbi:type II secretion system protein GspG [bacterium]|nr:type II secretion system protein GspG [bacterium]MCI0613536.1 type II secretion system protein GspG [bacterium]